MITLGAFLKQYTDKSVASLVYDAFKSFSKLGSDIIRHIIKLGMKTFLLTDNLINKSGADISAYVNGGFDEMLSYIKSLI